MSDDSAETEWVLEKQMIAEEWAAAPDDGAENALDWLVGYYDGADAVHKAGFGRFFRESHGTRTARIRADDAPTAPYFELVKWDGGQQLLVKTVGDYQMTLVVRCVTQDEHMCPFIIFYGGHMEMEG